MKTYYIKDPLKSKIIRELSTAFAQYYYFDSQIILQTKSKEVLNACLILGETNLILDGKKYDLENFDFFYLPPNHKVEINPSGHSKCKICYIKNQIKKEMKTHFEIKQYNSDNFVPRGELNPQRSISTYRTVWTAFKNGYFMSGITNIPLEALNQGVLTSVNLVKEKEEYVKIYPHIHPNFPELYIFCIDDKNYAITQYLINSEGDSICRDLKDGDGLFFPGSLVHMNFGKPTYRNIKYCMYIWIIPTFGITNQVNPITLYI
jgi:hypothetical protein